MTEDELTTVITDVEQLRQWRDQWKRAAKRNRWRAHYLDLESRVLIGHADAEIQRLRNALRHIADYAPFPCSWVREKALAALRKP